MKLLVPAARWFLLLLPMVAIPASAADLYKEPFRPQYHFTPATNWMNDPNGMVYFEGEYHLFYQYNPWGDKWGHMSWGHAVSRDMIHWEHLPVALYEENDVMIFSGSAVVDWKNTTGFGKDGQPPLVAIYTGHYTKKPLQNQQIAYSNDRGRTWKKFAGNPVLDIGEKDFRDPKVMWHEPTQRWIMTVAWPVPRKVRFYSSPDLKTWTHLSDFGPAGATSGIWECPDLFPLKSGQQNKWVLIVNVGSGAPAGGSGCQYFVGDFDGTRFTLDSSYPGPQPEAVPDGEVFADFEGENYGAWVATGTAFGTKPAQGKLGGQQAVDGFRGRALVNSFADGDKSEGTLTSPEFTITRNHLSFLIGGGNHPGKTCLNLIVDDRIVHTATGDNAERLAWKSWDVRELRGRKARLEIVDRHAGGWGHINVDHILLADTPARPARQPALWADYGPDFYAAVSWSDIPKRDGRRLWLGWMSNWQYANDVPTSPWRSAMSIPRELGLRATDAGLRMVQTPVKEMNSVQRSRKRFKAGTAAEANAWLARHEFKGELLELKFTLTALAAGSSPAGLKVFKGDREETVIGFDAREGGQVYLDRRHSGSIKVHPAFPGIYAAPLPASDSPIEMHVFLDACSVEVFVNGGEQVLTALVLPSAESRGLEFFGGKDEWKIEKLEVWRLSSAWQKARSRQP